ncbi:MAG: sigma-70 family RNA polymerase sigma factor [Verrucomicrobia bacterium]|nr:sigma-70 family RNA polymerase sigma factor [Verrucomicrobiota bacterium]
MPTFLVTPLRDEGFTAATGRFDTTCWTVVLLSAQSQAPGSDRALLELCQIYWYPLYSFVRRRGYKPEDAEDLTQGFFLHLLSHRALQTVQKEKGKFRSFLLASLQNYLSVQARGARAQKRGGDREIVSLDLEGAEERYRQEFSDQLTPEKIYDARWALSLLDRANERLRGSLDTEPKRLVFSVLAPFLSPFRTGQIPSYAQAAKELHISEPAVKTLIHRLRKQYTQLVREEVARTVENAADVDDEIRALCQALIVAEGYVSRA